MSGQRTHTVQLAQAPAQVLVVSVLAGPDQGRLSPTVARSVRIGAGPDADIQLTDPTISRLHCEITAGDGSMAALRDLGSKNGTWIAGARVREAELPDGARFVVGATTIELRIRVQEIATERFDGGDRLGPLLGSSPPMQRLFAKLVRVAATDEPVLVRGESGTGKELVARALHELGPRAKKPFVILDAGAIAGSLAEMELFGHGRGAFTGSHGERAGAFERAHGGTLFLDEIGELPLEIQPRLLRAVEHRTIQRLGDAQRRQVDVRLVAATHRSLAEMVNTGTFREDLYHRLSVLEVEVPPLRTRGDDLALLAHSILDKLAPGDAGARRTLDQALATRAGYPWPGNVRELRNFVARIAVLGEVPESGPGQAFAQVQGDGVPVRIDLGFHEAKQVVVDAFERRYLEHLLDETGGNASEAARRSGLSRGHLNEIIGRLGLRRRG